MEGFRVQPTRTAFSSVTPTATYANNAYTVDVAGFTKLTLDVDYTRGSGEASSKLVFKIEHSSDDGTTWNSLTIDDTTTSSVLTARTWEVQDTANLSVILDIAYKKLKISLIESGVVTNAGTASMRYTLSGI